MCALIGQKPMFNQSIKHRTSVFYCFSPHYLYKQMNKTISPVLHCDKILRTFENTREV